MDGTLLNDEGQVPEEFFDIFKKLKEKNILFVAASGRQYYNLVDKLKPIKDEILFVAENGTYVVQENQELYSSFLSRDTVHELIKLGKTLKDADIVLCGKECAYIEKNDENLINQVKKYYSRYKIVEDLMKVENHILKFTICDFKNASKNSNKVFYPLYGDKLQVVVSGELWLDIVNKGVNKGVSIKQLQEKFNISHKETMVFGDYFNDIEMLQNAYHSYAMENAPEGVKKHARFIAKSNSKNGVLQAIKEAVLKVS